MKNRKMVPRLLMTAIIMQFLLAANAFATTQMTINVTNNTTSTATPSSVQYMGTLTPTPTALNIGANQTFIDNGIGNITSFHANYSSGTKTCHFDSASYNQSGSTSPCVYTKAAKSTGSTSATCTAIVTAASLDPANCSFTVKFGIR
jgi:hypothetical protein